MIITITTTRNLMSDNPLGHPTGKLLVAAGVAALTAASTIGLYLYLKDDNDEATLDLLRRRGRGNSLPSRGTSPSRIKSKSGSRGITLGSSLEGMEKMSKGFNMTQRPRLTLKNVTGMESR